jgi:hypothetical protein
MNEILNTYATKALAWLESGATWLTGEIPLYVKEILKWEMAQAIVFLVILVLFLVGLVILMVTSIKREWLHGEAQALYMFPTFGICGLIAGITANLLTIIQIVVAPRVFLIEYITNLLG